MPRTVADLMRANLLEVFNEPDPERRAATVKEIYSDDVVWHEPDRLVRGREALARRALEMREETPDWVFRPNGPVSVNDDLGHLGFLCGPADQPPVVSGMDIARCKDGVIVELYTFVTEFQPPA
ncbi:nuclear transport factor 2 family protein [Streptacidiphilus anmyonensis]|uniref:nuclear transport factor 2 family protein n=1 Tax=Streptacidiphilus anmyonensis TaxID=405782 RepID=UPI0005A7A85D|nr:nuclear transport factor 2 family protein [Streptacidiphilus anmyonensis]